MAHGKKYNKAKESISGDLVSVKDGLEKVKGLSFVGFDESVDVSVNLGIDASKSDQVVRGSAMLPHGTGKKSRVIVFAKGEYADKASAAGADFVGTDDLVKKIEGGWLDFEYAVATPDMMGAVGKLAKVLGPKGLLPNKKTGTVTFDVGVIVAELKKGRAFFKNDKSGIVHFSIGKVSFDVNNLKENFVVFIKSLNASKPSASKGKFLKKVTISSTMGVGIPTNFDDVL
jgi:large subunit ribosomal protein L1